MMSLSPLRSLAHLGHSPDVLDLDRSGLAMFALSCCVSPFTATWLDMLDLDRSGLAMFALSCRVSPFTAIGLTCWIWIGAA